MKKIRMAIVLVIIMAIFCSLAITASADTRGVYGLYFQAKENVRFRYGPGEEYGIIGLFKKNDLFHSSHGIYAPWYYGHPEESTALYDEFGEIYGYTHIDYFRVY